MINLPGTINRIGVISANLGIFGALRHYHPLQQKRHRLPPVSIYQILPGFNISRLLYSKLSIPPYYHIINSNILSDYKTISYSNFDMPALKLYNLVGRRCCIILIHHRTPPAQHAAYASRQSIPAA